MVSTAFVLALVITVIKTVDGGDYIPETKCASLYQKKIFDEDTLVLNDFDQSVDILKEMKQTSKVRKPIFVEVEKGCQLEVCNLEYFGGSCHNLVNVNGKARLVSSLNTSDTRSAKCACQRECNCMDVFIPKDFSENPILGRGYFKGGCSTCNSEYVALRTCDSPPVPQKLEAIILRFGCILKIYSEPNYKGEERIIFGSVFEDAIEVPSYQILCNDVNVFAPEKPPVNSSLPKKLNLPESARDIPQMLRNDKTLKNHPGYNAILASQGLHSKTSHKNGYVVVIGTHQTFRSSFPQCQNGPRNQIGECHIPVSLDHLGLSSELRVVTAPIAEGTEPVEYNLQTSLGEFLSKHEELKVVKPNAVILYQELADDPSNVSSSELHVKLKSLGALRERLLPKDLFSNLVVLLDASKVLDANKSLDASEAVRYTSMYEMEINKALNPSWEKKFQRITICFTLDIISQTYFVNGNVKLFSGEFWPRNLEKSVVKNCEKSGDKFGQAIFKAVFQDIETPQRSIKQLNGNTDGDREWKLTCPFSLYESVQTSTEVVFTGMGRVLVETGTKKPDEPLEGSGKTLAVVSSTEGSFWSQLAERVAALEKDLALFKKEVGEYDGSIKSGMF